MLVKNRLYEPTPRLFSAPVVGDAVGISQIFGVRKLESLGYHMVLFAWSYIYPFCYNAGLWQTDRWADRRTHDGSILYHTSIASRSKNHPLVSSFPTGRGIATFMLALWFQKTYAVNQFFCPANINIKSFGTMSLLVVVITYKRKYHHILKFLFTALPIFNFLDSFYHLKFKSKFIPLTLNQFLTQLAIQNISIFGTFSDFEPKHPVYKQKTTLFCFFFTAIKAVSATNKNKTF